MWLYTDIGFFSIVQKDGAGTLTIRSRVKRDLVRFMLVLNQSLDVYPLPKIVESFDSDYRYRIIIPAKQAAKAVEVLVSCIRYDNFKDEIQRKDPERVAIYNRIWDNSTFLEHLDGEEE